MAPVQHIHAPEPLTRWAVQGADQIRPVVHYYYPGRRRLVRFGAFPLPGVFPPVRRRMWLHSSNVPLPDDGAGDSGWRFSRSASRVRDEIADSRESVVVEGILAVVHFSKPILSL